MGKIEVSGSVSRIQASHACFQGGCLQVRNEATARIEDCTFSRINDRVGLLVERASPVEVLRSVFENVFQPLYSLQTRVRVEGCLFTGTQGDAVVLDYPDDDILPPDSIRLTVPPRMVAGKTTTLRAEVLDRKGDLYWPMWTGRGTVSAVATDTGEPVPLSAGEFEFINGIGSLTTRLDRPGEVDLTVSVDGISASKRLTVLPISAPRLILSATLTDDLLDWGPEDGVIHLSGTSTVPETGTLTIRPGTLVMMDNRAQLRIDGQVNALGTGQEPIYFFSVHSATPWALLEHRNSETTSIFENVFFTGGGETWAIGHACGHAVYAATGRLEARECAFVDLVGKGILGLDAEVVLSRCLFSRCPMGAELIGHVAQVDECYFLDIHPDGDDRDGLYLWLPPPDAHVRRCIIARNGDDGIDMFGGNAEISDCLIYGASDKNVSLSNTGGQITNCLLFDARLGISPKGIGDCNLLIENCTLADHREVGFLNLNKYYPPGTPSSLQTTINECILWGNPVSIHTDFDPRNATLDHCDLNPPIQDFPEIESIYTDPQFMEPVLSDYRLQPESPARSAGPAGDQIGWLGYPSRETAPLGSPSTIRGCEFRSGQGRGVVASHNADCVVEGCEFSSLAEAGLGLSKKSAGMVSRCVFDRCGTGVFIETGAFASLAHVTIAGCTNAGVLLAGATEEWSGGRGELHSSILWKNGTGVSMEQGAEFSADHSNIGPGDGSILPGEGNVNIDPLFVEEENSDYHLPGHSPSVGTGRGGTEMGAFERPALEGGSGWVLR